MLIVNALPNSTIALLYDLQSELAQIVALRVGVFDEGRKWRNGSVHCDMKCGSLVEFSVANAVSSHLECSNILVLLLVKCVLPVFICI
jgi:hypothetical protein